LIPTVTIVKLRNTHSCHTIFVFWKKQ